MTTQRIEELEAENAELDKLAVSRWNIISDLQDVIERLTAENERLSLVNQSLREKIEAAGYSPNHDTDEIAQVERVLRQMVKRDAAKIKQLTAELAAVRAELAECQAAFENGRETERAAGYGELEY